MSWRHPAFLRGAALAAVALVWRLVLFVGPQGSDDLVYSELANDLTRGEGSLKPSIFNLRLGYIGAIALIYSIFGAGTFSLVLFNLLCSVAEVALAYRVAREFLDEAGAWTAAGIVAFFPLHVFFATEAHPDVPVALLTTIAVALFLKGRSTGRAAFYGAAGIALGVAHLMKESAFFGLAALLALAGRPRRQQVWVLAGFAGILALESAFYGIATGDPFFRIDVVRGRQATAMTSEYYESAVPTVRRLFWDIPAMLFYPGAGGYLTFTLFPAAALAGAVFVFLRKDAAKRPLVGWVVVLLVLVNFWPIQLWPYRPAMVAHPRILLVLVTPMAILAAYALRQLSSLWGRWAAAGLIAAAMAGNVILHQDGRQWSLGARLAFDHLPPDACVVADARTTQLFRLYDGYRAGSRRYEAWAATPPPAPCVLVLNSLWIDHLRSWYGTSPPAWVSERKGPVIKEFIVPGRFKLRSLVAAGPSRTPETRVILHRASQ